VISSGIGSSLAFPEAPSGSPVAASRDVEEEESSQESVERYSPMPVVPLET
jgi:hypothetical protein